MNLQKEVEVEKMNHSEIQDMINPCGTRCSECNDYNVVCDGCRNRDGMPIWYQIYDITNPCGYYECCSSQGYYTCAECIKVPCARFFEYPDPLMSDEDKQMWLKLRMSNFKKENQSFDVQLEEEFSENVRKFMRK